MLLRSHLKLNKGFPGGSDGKESTCNMGDSGLIPGLRRFPWRREWLPTPVFLPGKSHGQGRNPWGHKESNMSEQPALSFSFFTFTETN